MRSVEHADRFVVGRDDVATEDRLTDRVDDRLDQLGVAAHPVDHRRLGDLDSVALVDAVLPMEWQVILVLRGDHLSEQ